jgi:hypothetical protein
MKILQQENANIGFSSARFTQQGFTEEIYARVYHI